MFLWSSVQKWQSKILNYVSFSSFIFFLITIPFNVKLYLPLVIHKIYYLNKLHKLKWIPWGLPCHSLRIYDIDIDNLHNADRNL